MHPVLRMSRHSEAAVEEPQNTTSAVPWTNQRWLSVRDTVSEVKHIFMQLTSISRIFMNRVYDQANYVKQLSAMD